MGTSTSSRNSYSFLQSFYCNKPLQAVQQPWTLIKSMLRLPTRREPHWDPLITKVGKKLQRLSSLTCLFGLTTKSVLSLGFSWGVDMTLYILYIFQRQDWQFHNATSTKDFVLCNLQPAYEASNDPATRPCLGSVNHESPLSQMDTPVFRATYWCGQKCTYPSQELHNKLQQDLQAKNLALQQQKKSGSTKGRPTKVGAWHCSVFWLWSFKNMT